MNDIATRSRSSSRQITVQSGRWQLRFSRTRSFYVGAGRHPDSWWIALGFVFVDYVRA